MKMTKMNISSMVRERGFLSYCKEKKWLLIVAVIISVFMILILYRDNRTRENAFLIEDEKIVGVNTENLEGGLMLHLTAKQGDISIDRDVTLVKSQGGILERDGAGEYDPEIELEIEITRMIRGLNQNLNEEGDLSLPASIGDEAVLQWERPNGKGVWALPMLFPPMLMLFLYRGEKDEVKRREKREVMEIENALPSFNNKLILLLGSGLVYEDAIKRISGRSSNAQGSLLLRTLAKMISEAESTNGDATKMLKAFAGKRKIGELKRIMSIIMDNRKRGTDLRAKLAMEGELLWDKRKKKAEEMGRIAESKLTLPLGIMMIPILIVTAGPALMQM